MAEGGAVLEFVGQPASHDIITVDHALHEFSLDVAVRHASIDQEPLACTQTDDVHEKCEDNADVFSVLVDENKAVFLMQRACFRGHGLTFSFESLDHLAHHRLIVLQNVEETFDEAREPLRAF